MDWTYDLIVIGGGPGGYTAAIRSAQLGLKTAIVENRDFGGTCLNRGCIPTKTLLHAAKAYEEVKRFAEIGISVQGLSFDYRQIHRRKNEVVEKLRNGVVALLKSHKVDTMQGTATVIGPHRVRIAPRGEEVSAAHILIATGAEPARVPIPGIDLPNVMDSDGFLAREEELLPSVVIIGGGVIGVEFATVCQRLGSRVTIIEALDRLLPTMDRDFSQNLAALFKKQGIQVHTGAMVKEIRQEESLVCRFEKKGQEEMATGDGIVVAVGRRAHTEGLFGEGFSVGMERGFIVADGFGQTNVDSIYAIGDVVKGSIQLAHFAAAMGICAVETIAGHAPSIDLATVPGCVYTAPEIASVGLTAAEAKNQGIPIRTGKFLMAANGKSLVEQEDRGFVKIIAQAENRRILGAQLMCARATDLIAEMATAVRHGLTVDELKSVIRPHPTFCEAVTEALEDVDGLAIHSLRRP